MHKLYSTNTTNLISEIIQSEYNETDFEYGEELFQKRINCIG